MRFVFHPEGADPKSWEFRPSKLLNAECIEIEKRTGWDYSEWIDRFKNGNMTAITAFLFVMLRREHHALKWDEVRFTIDDVDLEADDDELAAARRDLAAIPDDERTPEQQAALDKLIADGVEPADPKV